VDVFLVPAGGSRHELYCEVAEAPPPVDEEESRAGFVRRLVARFREILATAEREHRERQSGASRDPHEPKPFMRRVRDRTMRWIAESIAEQRLLWHLRRCQAATLIYPQDLSEREARAALMEQLGIDYVRHRRWFVIDLLGFVASGAVVWVPGPNVLAYYFLFRFGGHFLSMRGARQGLQVVRWRADPNPALSELRATLALDPDVREVRLRDIAQRLHLEHLTSFVQRIATV
jgi:Mitochondrial K+-H+ exchange-related